MAQVSWQQQRAPVIRAALLAIACTLLLQPLFAGALVLLREHTDLPAVMRHVAQAYNDGVLAQDEKPRLFLHRYGQQFIECTALQVTIDDQPDPVRAALMPQLHSLYVDPCRELLGNARGVATDERTDYSRYWQGYRAYLWPALEHLSLAGVRALNAALLVLAVLYFHRCLRLSVGATAAGVVLAALLCLTDLWRIWRFTPQELPMLLILAGSGAFARLYAARRAPLLAVALAAAFGAVFNFVDFLINPPMMPMLLAFVVLAVDAPRRTYDSRREVIDALWLPALVIGAWMGAYLLTWAVKWLIAIQLSTDPGHTAVGILDQIRLRLYGAEADTKVWIIPLLPTVKMIIQCCLAVGIIPFGLLVARIVGTVRSAAATFDRRKFLVLSAPLLVSVAWFEALSNHTQTHSHFTYRSAAAAVGIVGAAALLSLARTPTLRELLRGRGPVPDAGAGAAGAT